MKKILLQLDTDALASAFDAVVAYDGGVDHLVSWSGVDAKQVGPIVEGAIYTRPPKHKKDTALFIGGSDLAAGETLLEAVRKHFFEGFRVSVMLDSNGGNTTAAAAVALLAQATPLAGKAAVVLAGTGPVGSRAAALLALAGARVTLCSRTLARAEQACARIARRFECEVYPHQTASVPDTAEALAGAAVVLAAGKAGVRLLDQATWTAHEGLEVIADLSTAPPAGIEGIDLMDRGVDRGGKRTFGGIGIGALKLRLHRACVARLFESNDAVLDAQTIYRVAEGLISD